MLLLLVVDQNGAVNPRINTLLLPSLIRLGGNKVETALIQNSLAWGLNLRLVKNTFFQKLF